MSSEQREKLTVAEWLNGFLTMPDMREKIKAGEFRTDEEKEAIFKEQEALFEGVDPGQISCGIIYLVQVLKGIDPSGTVYLLETLGDLIQREEMLKVIPASLRKLFERIMSDE